jgi:hypothetical protein
LWRWLLIIYCFNIITMITNHHYHITKYYISSRCGNYQIFFIIYVIYIKLNY